jgi:N-methylhydantoinase A
MPDAVTRTFPVCGIDIGGTFTDCVLVDAEARVYPGKAPTTPDNLTVGFFDALGVAAQAAGCTLEEALAGLQHLGHGSTVATNIMVQRSGAKVALLTTNGHRDVTLIQRAAGRVAGLAPSQLLDLVQGTKPEPLVPGERIREVDERMDLDGDVVIRIDGAAAARDIETLLDDGVEALAVCLLWSFRNPEHEQELVRLIADAERGRDGNGGAVFVSASHEVAPTWGEYERAMTTIINAYVGPRTGRYIRDLADELEAREFGGTFSIMKSDGGGATLADAARFPVALISSGPAGGLAATAGLAATIGATNAIATDMGGTSFDIGLVVDGTPVSTNTAIANRFEFNLPTLDIRSVGSGGGSIAWVDAATGSLRVGPESAGSIPGPVAYGRGGTQPTVTDADIVLGYLNPEYFLGGRLTLDAERAEEAIAALGTRLGLDTMQTAAGIRRIVDAQMADATRMMTIERGYDPRDFVLFSFGGAGPVHGADYARELGVEQVVIPLAGISSLWSAYGIANADLVHIREYSEVMSEPFDAGRVRTLIAELSASVTDLFDVDARDRVRLEFTASFKYQLQAHVVPVPITLDAVDDIEAVVEQFEQRYRDLYGEESGFRAAGIELTGFTCKGTYERTSTRVRTTETRDGTLEPAAHRPVHWVDRGETVDTPVYRWSAANAGATIAGPAIVELAETTIVVPSDFRATSDEFTNLLMTRVEA